MLRQVVLAALVLLIGCERRPPPPAYVLRFPFSVPDGTEVVVDGSVVGSFADQKAKVQLPEGRTLHGAQSLAVRFPTVCGHADRPFRISPDAVEGLKRPSDDAKGRSIAVVLEMAPEHLVRRTAVWVDPEAEGEVKIGAQTLGAGPNRVLLADCDDEGRGVTVGEEPRGPAPVVDPKSGQQIFIPARTEGCYALREHVYEEGKLEPKPRTSEPLSGKPLYRLPLVNFFLRDAPETIEVIPGTKTEVKKALARVDCGGEGGSGE